MPESPRHVTLTASTVTTITFTYDYQFIEVLNVDGAAAVYFTLDGTVPAVGADGTEVLPAAISSLASFRRPAGPGPTVIKLISAGTPQISVAGRNGKSRSS